MALAPSFVRWSVSEHRGIAPSSHMPQPEAPSPSVREGGRNNNAKMAEAGVALLEIKISDDIHVIIGCV